MVYVANGGNVTNSVLGNGTTVTVINGSTNATSTVSVGTYPVAVAVNPVTNNIYVANFASNNVTVINGGTNATTTVAAGAGPNAIAINSVTNKIYVVNEDGGSVTVIDGVTNSTTTVTVGLDPETIALNPVTNKIYVANDGGNTVTVIDGATNLTTAVTVGNGPNDLAVNPVTNQIYVENGLPFNTTVINGATNATANVAAAGYNIAVNSVTNQIYTVSDNNNDVDVINGATNAVTKTGAVGNSPEGIAVDPVTNQIYVANYASNNVTVVNGSTNAITTVPVGGDPEAIAVNLATNNVYVANQSSNNVTVIKGAPLASGVSSARLINISTRAQVGTGGNILIPGLVIGGSGTETLLIRGDGPSLTGFGVSGALAQPSLSVFNSAGTMIASNTGWGTNSSPAQIASIAAQVGAFPFASGSADCALMVSLPAGAYTVQISGVGNTSGVALAEVYEVSSTGTRLVNISTRAQVGTGSNIIIPGFVISGSGTEELLVRADGPALTQFGVTGVLAQPSLSVYSGSSLVASNTAWGTNADVGLIAGFEAEVGAFPLTAGSADSVQFVNLSPGAYTMQISGVNSTTGVSLAEVYEAP